MKPLLFGLTAAALTLITTNANAQIPVGVDVRFGSGQYFRHHHGPAHGGHGHHPSRFGHTDFTPGHIDFRHGSFRYVPPHYDYHIRGRRFPVTTDFWGNLVVVPRPHRD